MVLSASRYNHHHQSADETELVTHIVLMAIFYVNLH